MTTPAPIATPCTVQNADPHVVYKAAAVMPDNARVMGIRKASVLIVATVGEDGAPTKITIYRSAGIMSIDQMAMQAARKSTYSPRLIDCKPASDNVLVEFDFHQ